MSAAYSASLPVSRTEPELAALKLVYDGRSQLMPIDHSARYKQQLLAGEKPIHFRDYLACLRQIARRWGRDTVAAVVNPWLLQFGLIAKPLASTTLKPVESEQVEAAESFSDFFATVALMKRGGFTLAELNTLRRKAAAHDQEIDDLVAAIEKAVRS